MGIVGATRQSWKLVTGAACLLACGYIVKHGHQLGGSISCDYPYFRAIGALGIFLSIGFPLLAIRCPACKKRWFWMAANEQGVSTWLPWLFQLKSCPACGFSPERDRAQPKAGK